MIQLEISNAEIEEFCEEIVKDYINRYTPGMEKVNIHGLITEYLGLKIEAAFIAEDDETIIAYLSNGKRPLQIRSNGKTIRVLYPKNTIVIDQSLLVNDKVIRRRFCMAHEAGHYLIDKLCRTNINVTQSITADQLHYAYHVEESRANKFAAALLLPKFIVEDALKKYNNGNPIHVFGENVFAPRERMTLNQMTNLLGVSFQTLYIRFKQFGMLDYRPFGELLENHIFESGGSV